jgi:hypothetical protein
VSLKTRGFVWDTKMLVSSANKIGTDVLFINLGKSFINIRKVKRKTCEEFSEIVEKLS